MVTKLKTYLVQAGIIVSLFCFSTACAEKEQVIAQVGDSELTRTEAVILMKHQGTNSNNKEEFNRFIQEWVDREVFVQELKKVDIEKWRLVEARSKNFQSELSKYYIVKLSPTAISVLISPGQSTGTVRSARQSRIWTVPLLSSMRV